MQYVFQIFKGVSIKCKAEKGQEVCLKIYHVGVRGVGNWTPDTDTEWQVGDRKGRDTRNPPEFYFFLISKKWSVLKVL